MDNVTGETEMSSSGISDLVMDVTPSIRPEQAALIARTQSLNPLASAPSLKLIDLQGKGDRLTYIVDLKSGAMGPGADVYVDAKSGEVYATLSKAHSANPIAAVEVYSTGKGGLMMFRKFATDILGRKILNPQGLPILVACAFVDIKTQKPVLKYNSKEACLMGLEKDPTINSAPQIVDEKGDPLYVNKEASIPVIVKGTVVRGAPQDPSAVRAGSNSSKVLNYYSQKFNRNGYDNKGSNSVSIVHAGIKLSNAFWSEDLGTMSYGDGDGVCVCLQWCVHMHAWLCVCPSFIVCVNSW
jgi:hypothetical protein